MAPIQDAENSEPISDFAKARMENMKALAEARAALNNTANDFNSQLKMDNNNDVRRHTMSPGKARRDRSPLIERKSGRLSGRPAIDYGGLEFDEPGMKRYAKRSHLDEEERLMAKLTPGGIKRRRRSSGGYRSFPVPELKPEDVSEDMMKNISYASTNKVYHADLGKSCHQCRQKTVDTKSVCRSGFCFGVRGQFCGACLKDHYGEDLAEVLKDANWSCPMCRNICNCSFCRKRAGKAPLGQVSALARRKGFKSVHHFLMAHEGPSAIEETDFFDEAEEDESNVEKTEEERECPPSALLIKLPFHKAKKNKDEKKLEKDAPKMSAEEIAKKELKKQRKALKSKAEMEKLVLKFGFSLPDSKAALEDLQKQLEKEMEIDWDSTFASDDKPFEGFAVRGFDEILTEMVKKEARQQKFKTSALLQKEMTLMDCIKETLTSDESFEGY